MPEMIQDPPQGAPSRKTATATLELPAPAADLPAALRTHFGYDRFRPGQEAVVRSVLSGRPTIAILPTGGGKSLCFQLPAMLLQGTTVVVSPLLALMKDQVDALAARGIPATLINSSLAEGERQERQAQLRRGAWRLVYVAPERFRSGTFLQALAGVRVPLLAIDEAHCISAWGHDFRPDYARLAQVRTQISAERVLALTATATPEVRRDIAQALQLREPKVFVAGFDRPNLFIETARVSGDKDKLSRLVALARDGGAGLIYAATRRNVEKVVLSLRGHGVDAVGYHAGMEDDERISVQDRFLRGQARVIVATNAFGMGIDKPDIRFVSHFDVPRSVEAYYQEIGRAGRDGKPSLALLLFNFADVMLQRRMIEGGRASEAVVRAVWDAALRLRSGSIDELARVAGAPAAELQPALRLLETAGHLERGRARGPAGDFSVATPQVGQDELQIDFQFVAQRVARERQMLDRMVRLADTGGCRRQNLLRYFGDADTPDACSACDNCVGTRAPAGAALREGKPLRRRSESRGFPADAAQGALPGAGASATAALSPEDAEVFQALRALRTELAREGKVPPYVIFHDATLRELSAALPESQTDFLAVKGAGPQRWERYGERVLAVTRPAAERRRADPPATEHPRADPPAADQRADPPAAQASAPTFPSGPGRAAANPAPRPMVREDGPSLTEQPPPSLEAPSWLEPGPSGVASVAVLSAYRAGATLAQIVERSGQTSAEVVAHLAQARTTGAKLDLAQLLGAERTAAIRSAALGSDGDLVAVRRRLPFAAGLAEIRLALLP